jgi:hypothetical protein
VPMPAFLQEWRIFGQIDLERAVVPNKHVFVFRLEGALWPRSASFGQ